jgi:hypothetical protein
MPYSSHEGKDLVKDFFKYHKYMTMLDIGPGAGTYADLLKDNVSYGTAIEVFSPYVEQFNLRDKYREVILCDVRYLDWNTIMWPDVTILGDVLEHMHYDEAKAVLANAVSKSCYVVVSLPIIEYPQGAEMGNIHEEHVEEYNSKRVHEELLRGCVILKEYEGEVTGTYIIEGMRD